MSMSLCCMLVSVTLLQMAVCHGNNVESCDSQDCSVTTDDIRQLMKEPLKVLLFMGSTRDGRMCTRVTEFVNQQLENTGHEVTIFDPDKMEFPLLKQALHFYPDETKAPQWLREADKGVRAVDAFVIVTSEYNAGVPAPLKNMLDHFSPDAFASRPSALVTYSLGHGGGMRVMTLIRPVLSDLMMPAIP